jgi:hypothetical protein
MSYQYRPVRGKPQKGEGYPTVDSDGNITLPGESEPIPPSNYHSVTISSEASPNLAGLGKGAVGISTPPGTTRNRPERPSERRPYTR